MTLIKDPRKMLLLLLITLAIAFAFIMARHYHAQAYLAGKIGGHLEITATGDYAEFIA